MLKRNPTITPPTSSTNSTSSSRTTTPTSTTIATLTPRPWSTTAWAPLHRTYHITPYGQRTTRYHTAVSRRIQVRFNLHNAGLTSGFWREWAAGFIVADCDEGVFMFSNDFWYACLVAVDFEKALRVVKEAGDGEMEGCWRRGGEAYDAKKGGQWPGDGGEGK